MPPIIIDVGIAALVLGMTYALMSEGAWGATLMFFNSVFAGLITFNFYEPLAKLIGSNVEFLSGCADSISMLVIFGVSLLLLRLATETLAPAMVRLPVPVYHIIRLTFGLGGSCVVMAIIILAFEASPVHRKVLGAVDYAYQPPFKLGFDRAWLAFVQWSSGYTFPRYGSGLADSEFPNTHVFDPRGEWLLVHQDARPYGKGSVIEDAPAEGAAAGGEAGGAAGEVGSAPAGAAGAPGPGIPGGTAGAAAGLAPTTP